jgi:hypothetical protein
VLNVGPNLKDVILLHEQAIFDAYHRWISVYGESVYDVNPTDIKVDNAKDFVMKGKDCYYLFVHDLSSTGDINVVLGDGIAKKVVISGMYGKIKKAVWIDSGENIKTIDTGDTKSVLCEQFSYSRNLVVRVAKIVTG